MSAAPFRLHYHPLSSYSRKVQIGMALRGDPVELVVLDVFGGALRTPEFLALSPMGKMPVLETPAGPLYESTSILEYLEEQGPRVLLPPGHERHARHLDRVGDLYLLEPIGSYFWRKGDEQREQCERTMARAWPIFERALADGRAFVCGDTITLGDLSAAIAAHYATTEGVALPEAIVPYCERLAAHPVLAASSAAAMPFVEATRARRMAP